MGTIWFRVLVLPAVCAFLLAAQQTKTQVKTETKGTATASGVFLGRSGKPMARARLILGSVVGNEDTAYATIRLGASPPSAVTDENGRFQITGFAPGQYTFLYQPAGATPAPPPPEIDITKLAGVLPSIMPALNNVEIGKTEPFPDRRWAGGFTLIKGHTMYCIQVGGGFMKIWNGTARRGLQGLHLEFRRGAVVRDHWVDKSEKKLEAWSF